MEKESAGLRARSHPNRSILRKVVSPAFKHAVQRAMVQRLSNQISSLPKNLEPKNRVPSEDMIDTFDTY